jgi:putative DNA primase/helicase
MIWHSGRRYPAGSFFGPKTQPEADPEPEVAPEEEPDEEAWIAVERTTDVVLSKKDQLDNAKLFAKDKLTLTNGKSKAWHTRFYQEAWWQWNGAFYEKSPEQRIFDLATGYMDGARVKGDDQMPFRPTTRDVGALMTFVRTCVGLDDRAIPPRWLDGRVSPKPAELLSFRNCLVDATTGKTYRHDPRLWLHDGVDFDYNPAAVCPTWEWFLKELFPTDEEVREVIEQFLGCGMTIENQFEKAALWVGPARSGRGTIASILEKLVGPNGHTSLNMHTWRGENSRMGMIGKRVGIFHDVRLKPPKQYGHASFDPGGVDPHSQQLLLELISGDLTEIGRKYLEAWKGLPFLKFLMISNTVPNLNDEVLITRFNTIEFQRSYLGKERPEIKKRLLPAEIAGIAARCVAAYGRLLRKGYFVQPASGLALLNRVKATVNPWQAFMDFFGKSIQLAKALAVAFSTSPSSIGACKRADST